MSEEERDQIFISYSHKDKVWLERIRTHLSGAVRNRVIDPWDDSKIRPGSNWKDEIKRALARAKVAVILVSPNFVASEYIAQHEFPPLIEAAQKEGLTIFWILVSSCMYEDCGIQHYQAAHDIAKPLDQLKSADRNAVLTQICRKVREAATKAVRSFEEELFENFRPKVIAPRRIQKAPNRMNWNRDGTIARSVKGHGYYRIKKQYVPEPGVEEERYLGWYQAGGHAFDPNGGFMPISGPIHGYKTLQEAQRACEEDDETTSRNLGL